MLPPAVFFYIVGRWRVVVGVFSFSSLGTVELLCWFHVNASRCLVPCPTELRMTKGSKGVRESEDTDVAATMPTLEPAEHTWASKEDDTDPCFLQSWKNIQSCMVFLFSQIQLYTMANLDHIHCVFWEPPGLVYFHLLVSFWTCCLDHMTDVVQQNKMGSYQFKL